MCAISFSCFGLARCFLIIFWSPDTKNNTTHSGGVHRNAIFFPTNSQQNKEIESNVKDSDLRCEKIAKIDAFQQLIPDSWLSPKKENAQIFLDWFNTLNCYQLTYSKNEEMIKTVSKIFDNDL